MSDQEIKIKNPDEEEDLPSASGRSQVEVDEEYRFLFDRYFEMTITYMPSILVSFVTLWTLNPTFWVVLLSVIALFLYLFCAHIFLLLKGEKIFGTHSSFVLRWVWLFPRIFPYSTQPYLKAHVDNLFLRQLELLGEMHIQGKTNQQELQDKLAIVMSKRLLPIDFLYMTWLGISSGIVWGIVFSMILIFA